ALAGHQVTLVCPLGDDPEGEQIRELIHPDVRLAGLPWQEAIAQKTRVRADGRTLLRIDHPARPYTGEPGALLGSSRRGRRDSGVRLCRGRQLEPCRARG